MQNGHVEISSGLERGHAGQGQGQVEVVVGQNGSPQGLEVGVRGRAGQQHTQLPLHHFDESRAGIIQLRKLARLGRDAHGVTALAGRGRRDLEGGAYPTTAGRQGHAAAVEHAAALAQLHGGRAPGVAFKAQLGLDGELVAAEGHPVVGEAGQAQVALRHGVAHGHAVNRKVIIGVGRAAALVHEAVAEQHHAGQVAAVVGLAGAREQLVEVGGARAEA